MQSRSLDGLILSSGRAGSTAIYHYLSEMGELNLPNNKEPHYWCSPRSYGGMYPLLEKILIEQPTTYEELYANSRLMIDASVGYFFSIEEVVRRLKEAHQNPKVVILYREPLTRARSFFNEVRRKQLEPSSSFNEALKRDRAEGLWWEYYYDNVPYAEVVRLVSQNFGKVMAVDYKAFSKNPQGVTEEIGDFLGVAPRAAVDYRSINSSHQGALRGYSTALPALARLVPKGVKRRIMRAAQGLRASNFSVDAFEKNFPYSLKQYSDLKALTGGKDIFYVAGD